MHLDLTQTNLTEYMLWRLGKALKRAKSLVSIHFSGNQSITPALKQQLFQRVRCAQQPLQQKIGLDVGLPSQMYNADGSGLTSPRKMAMHMNQEKYFRENMLIRNFKRSNIRGKLSEIKEEGNNTKLIFERQLGHKLDLPGAAQWRQLDRADQECWICDKASYCLVFWSKRTGAQDEDSITVAQEENLVSQIERANNQFEDFEWKGPVYFCQMTGWKPMPMLPLIDFCHKIDREATDQF